MTAPVSPSAAPAQAAQAAQRESLRDRFNLKYWTFRTVAALTPLMPLWLARRIAVAGGMLAWALAAPQRRRAERNLAHIPTLAADPARLRWATRSLFKTLALNYLDFFRGRHVTYEELAQGWEIKDWDLFIRAMRGGRGVIVLGAHMGPFEYSAWKLGELGYPLLTPAERLRPERLNTLVTQLRNHHEARLLPGDDRETLRELLSSLRRGQMAMFAIDRWVLGPSDAWPLFGAPARLPTAPFALAARSEAPVFLLIPWRVGFNRIEAVVELITPERMPPNEATPAAGQERAASQRVRNREAAIAQMRARVYALLERYISAHPDQWVSALSPVWEFPTPAAPADATTPRQAVDGEETPQTHAETPSVTTSQTQMEAARLTAGETH